MKYIVLVMISIGVAMVGNISTPAESFAEGFLNSSEVQLVADNSAAKQTTLDAKKKKKKKQAKLKKKFCCKTASGTSCYVFGNASCSNCTNFCSGDMGKNPAEIMVIE